VRKRIGVAAAFHLMVDQQLPAAHGRGELAGNRVPGKRSRQFVIAGAEGP
jgi:hypothetical protein